MMQNILTFIHDSDESHPVIVNKITEYFVLIESLRFCMSKYNIYNVGANAERKKTEHRIKGIRYYFDDFLFVWL